MKNKRLFLIIGIVIILILVVSGGLYLFNKKGTGSVDQKYLTIDLSKAVADRTIEYNEALATLKKNPVDYSARRMIGIIKDVTGDYVGAEAIYQELLEEKPADVLIMNNLANIYYNTKRYTEAETMNYRTLAENSKWAAAYSNLNDLYTWQLKNVDTEKYLTLLLAGYKNYPEMKATFTSLLKNYYTDIKPNTAEAAKYEAETSTTIPAGSGNITLEINK